MDAVLVLSALFLLFMMAQADRFSIMLTVTAFILGALGLAI